MSTATIATCLTELGTADLARVSDHDYAGVRAAAARTCEQLRDEYLPLPVPLPNDAADDIAQDAVLALAYSLRAAEQWKPQGLDGDGLVVAWLCARPGREPLFVTRQALHAWAVWQALRPWQPCPFEPEPQLEFLADLDRFDIGQLAAA